MTRVRYAVLKVLSLIVSVAFGIMDTFTDASVDFVLQSYSVYSFFQQDHHDGGRDKERIGLFEGGCCHAGMGILLYRCSCANEVSITGSAIPDEFI